MTDSEPRIRAEIRARAPCPVCQQPAFLDPPCTITDMRTGATRVEQHINCTKCNTAHHWKPGMTRNQQSAAKEKQANGATLCLCGCGQFCRPGRPYLKGHKLEPVPPSLPTPSPTTKEEEPMSQTPDTDYFPPIRTASPPPVNDEGDTETRKLCPCKCGDPVHPGKKFAGRGCVGRARRGVPMSPEVLAKRSATIRKARGKTRGKTTPPVVLCEKHDCNRAAQPGKTLCTPCLEIEPLPMDARVVGPAATRATHPGKTLVGPSPEEARDILEAIEAQHSPDYSKVGQDRCPYQTVAELARNHDSKTLRAAANLRDMVGAA